LIQISAALNAALNAPANQPVVLYELHLTSGVRYYSTEDITWGGHHYLPYVTSRSSIRRFEGAEFDRVTVTLSNVDTAIAQILTTEEVEGRRLVIRLVDRTVSDDSLVLLDGAMERASKIDEMSAAITATQIIGSIEHEAPSRKFTAYCPWKFKSDECGYVGAETSCNKSWARCGQLGRTNHYGGFRFIPHGGTYQYEQVEQKRFLLMFSRKSKKTVTASFNAIDDTPYDVPIPIVLGRSQIAAITIQHSDEGGQTKVLAALCVGTIQQILYLRANGALVADWTGHHGQVGGTTTQLVDPRFPNSYPYHLVAYIGATIPSDVQAVDPAPTVDAVVLGCIVDFYDSAGSWTGYGWSDNPVWLTRHFMTMPLAQGGMGLTEDQFDYAIAVQSAAYCDELIMDTTNAQTIYEPSSIPAAVVVGEDYQRYQSTGVDAQDPGTDGPYTPYVPGTSDTSVTPTPVPVKRFTMNVALAKAEKAIDILYKKLLPSFRGYLTTSKSGKIQIRVERPVSNTTSNGSASAGSAAIGVAANAFAAGDLVLVGALTAQAEVRTVASCSGGVLTLTVALANAHAAGETIHSVVLAFNDSNMLNGFEYPLSDRQPSTNRVTVKYVDAPAGFESRALEVNDYEHQDIVHKVNNEDFDGSAIDNYCQAYRIGQWRRAKMRDLGKFCSLKADIKASVLEVGDIIAVSASETGLSCVPFRVLEVGYDETDDVSIVGQIYSLGIYDDTAPQTTVTVPSVYAAAIEAVAGAAPVATPLDYGAIGDGAANDTTPVRACALANDAWEIPAGYTFLVDGVTISNRSGVNISGGGALKLRAGANATLLDVVNSPRTTINGVELDGNKAAQTAPAPALRLTNAAYSVVSGCTIHDASGDGLVLINQNASSMADEVRITGNYIQANAGHGLHSLGTGATIQGPGDNLIQGNHIDANGSHGIWLENGNHNILSENNVLSNSLHGVKVEWQTGLEFSGNKVRNNNANGGVFVRCSHGRIAANEFQMNSRGSGYSGMDIDSCSDMQVDANYTGDQGATIMQSYGLQIYGPSYNIRLTGNNFGVGENVYAAALIATGSTYTAYNNKGIADNRVPMAPPPAPSNATFTITGSGDVWGVDSSWTNPAPVGNAVGTERRVWIYTDAGGTVLEDFRTVGNESSIDVAKGSDGGDWPRSGVGDRWIKFGTRTVNYEGTPSAWAYAAGLQKLDMATGGSGSGDGLADLIMDASYGAAGWNGTGLLWKWNGDGSLALRARYRPPLFGLAGSQTTNMIAVQAFVEDHLGDIEASAELPYTGNATATDGSQYGYIDVNVATPVAGLIYLQGCVVTSVEGKQAFRKVTGPTPPQTGRYLSFTLSTAGSASPNPTQPGAGDWGNPTVVASGMNGSGVQLSQISIPVPATQPSTVTYYEAWVYQGAAAPANQSLYNWVGESRNGQPITTWVDRDKAVNLTYWVILTASNARARVSPSSTSTAAAKSVVAVKWGVPPGPTAVSVVVGLAGGAETFRVANGVKQFRIKLAFTPPTGSLDYLGTRVDSAWVDPATGAWVDGVSKWEKIVGQTAPGPVFLGWFDYIPAPSGRRLFRFYSEDHAQTWDETTPSANIPGVVEVLLPREPETDGIDGTGVKVGTLPASGINPATLDSTLSGGVTLGVNGANVNIPAQNLENVGNGFSFATGVMQPKGGTDVVVNADGTLSPTAAAVMAKLAVDGVYLKKVGNVLVQDAVATNVLLAALALLNAATIGSGGAKIHLNADGSADFVGTGAATVQINATGVGVVNGSNSVTVGASGVTITGGQLTITGGGKTITMASGNLLLSGATVEMGDVLVNTSLNVNNILLADSTQVVASKPIYLNGGFGQPLIAQNALLSPTGQSGKFIRSNGTNWEWASVSSGGAAWGAITGTLSAQTDLNAALGNKSNTDHNHLYGNLANLPTLGTAAAKNVGTGAADVAPGNHTHTQYVGNVDPFITFGMTVQDAYARNAFVVGGSGNISMNMPAFDVPLSVYEGGTGSRTAAGARGNLGLGAAATMAVGTGAGTLAAGDHGHSGYASSSHTHAGVYADASHSHAGYADASHTHTGYAASSHGHSTSDITNLDASFAWYNDRISTLEAWVAAHG
jgi:parallel beta-helix repeat protein